MEHVRPAEVRSRAGLTDAGIPKRDRRRVSVKNSCPHTTAYEKSGHCRIEETEEDKTTRGNESEEDTEKNTRKGGDTGFNKRLMTPFSRISRSLT